MHHGVFAAKQRSGLQFTAVNWHLTAAEAGYVVTDSGARVVVVSSGAGGPGRPAWTDAGAWRAAADDRGHDPGWDSYQDTVDALPTAPIPDECEGDICANPARSAAR